MVSKSMDKYNIKNKIIYLLKDFETSKKATSEFVQHVVSFEIPTYMVLIVLVLSKIPLYGKSGKSLFACTIRYKDVDFMLQDIKGYKCRIYSTEKDDKIELLSKLIKKKIIRACDLLDGILSEELMENVVAGNFFIDNSYIHLRRHFERLAKDLDRQLNLSGKGPEGNELADLLNFQFDSMLKVEQISFSLLNVFYSLTDFIFVMFDIMENNDPSWENSSNFMYLSWNEKFKKVLGVKNTQIKFFHDKLLDFKNSFRNPFSHGIIGESSLLVRHDVVGLIPLSYKKFLSGYQLFGVDSDRSREIIKFTKEFLYYLENKPPYNFYMKFLSYSLPIPVERNSLQELRGEMTNMDTFVEFVERKAQLQDMYDNFDY